MKITLLGKPGCHLCDDARVILAEVCGELGMTWEEVSVLDDPALADEFWDRIPVIKVDDLVVGSWPITTEQLRSALR